jgi:hypothetical protein
MEMVMIYLLQLLQIQIVKMKKILLLCVIIFLASCNGDDDEIEKNIYIGTQGVTLDIFNNKLPDTAYENQDFNFIIKLENVGAYPSSNTRLIVSLEKGYLEFANGNNIFEKSGGELNLRGKTTVETFNDFAVIELPIRINEIDPQSEYHDTTILTTLCYDYTNLAFVELCIDTDPYGSKSIIKTCSLQESISMSGGQGGPISVTSIEPQMLVNNNLVRPHFVINIQNHGGGIPISTGSGGQVCNSNALGPMTYNAVSVNVELSEFSNQQFDCFPREVMLRHSTESVTCTLKEGVGIPKTSASFMTPLKVTLNYGYTESISKEIKILKILQY